MSNTFIRVLSLDCLAGLSDADSSNFPHSKAESKLFFQSKNQCKMSLCKRTRILEGVYEYVVCGGGEVHKKLKNGAHHKIL